MAVTKLKQSRNSLVTTLLQLLHVTLLQSEWRPLGISFKFYFTDRLSHYSFNVKSSIQHRISVLYLTKARPLLFKIDIDQWDVVHMDIIV